MVKTLTDMFKIGKSKGKKLDLVTAVNEKDYEAKFNDIYSTAQSDREKYERLLNRYSNGDILKQEKKNYGFGKKIKKTIATLATIAYLTGCAGPTDPRPDPEPPVEEPTAPTTPTEPTTPTNPPVDPAEPTKDYIDFSGKVEDCETDTGRFSTVQIYETENVDETYSNLLKETSTDANGNWKITLDKVVDPSDKIYVRVRTGTSSSTTSYIRTIELPATDHNPITDPRANPAIRVVPYNPNWTLQQIGDFLIHAGRANIWSDNEKIAAGIDGFVNGNSQHGLKKSDNIKGIKVSTSTPNYASYVSEINAKGIKTITEENPVYEKGWGVILPDTTGEGPRTLLYDTEGLDGQVEGFVTYLNNCSFDVGKHEWWWHGMKACSGHVNNATVAEKFPSEGRWQSPYPATSPKEDKILYSIIEDPTFLGMESEKRIMSLN